MKDFTRFVGLDESMDAIQVAIASARHPGEVREYGSIANTPEALRKLVRRLGRLEECLFAYEAGPCGYGTYRFLSSMGAKCLVVAPSNAE